MVEIFSRIRYSFNPRVMSSLLKMRKLRQNYKMEKDKSRKSGNGTAKRQWKYFSKINAFVPLFKRGGFRQPRTACSRPYMHCRRYNACKRGARDDLVSSLSCDRRFRNKPYNCLLFESLSYFFEQPVKARRMRV